MCGHHDHMCVGMVDVDRCTKVYMPCVHPCCDIHVQGWDVWFLQCKTPCVCAVSVVERLWDAHECAMQFSPPGHECASVRVCVWALSYVVIADVSALPYVLY